MLSRDPHIIVPSAKCFLWKKKNKLHKDQKKNKSVICQKDHFYYFKLIKKKLMHVTHLIFTTNLGDGWGTWHSQMKN